jgi:peptidoglycan/LPS O-acetylase OafA/YrhL
MTPSPTYRPEIDGLRAVAVLAVILYHAGVPGFGGGYVGVDVFFVISGYLITSLIVQDLEAGTFSLVRFYERRARRILPAMLLVLSVVMVGAWFILLPIDAVNVYQSILAALAMVSNILFWWGSGYFDAAAELKPLLHTWSLAVEEQFYLLYPLGMLALWKVRRKWFAPVVGLLAVASLAAAQWMGHDYPDAAFFLLPMRAWELLAGALTAWLLPNHRYHWRESGWHRQRRQVGGLIGLALVIAPMMAYSERMMPIALAVPVAGATLVIVFATPGTLVGRLLASSPAVAVGLISYSAYMIHEPLFVALRMLKSAPPALPQMLTLVVLTMLLAWACWRFVEQPFRRADVISSRLFFSVAAVAVALLGIAAGIGYGTNGFENVYIAVCSLPESWRRTML